MERTELFGTRRMEKASELETWQEGSFSLTSVHLNLLLEVIHDEGGRFPPNCPQPRRSRGRLAHGSSRLPRRRQESSRSLASEKQGYGNLMLTPEQQADFVQELPDAFLPIPGGWGRMGMTHIRLAKASIDVLAGALRTAWGTENHRGN